MTPPEQHFARFKTVVAELQEVLECHHVTGADSLVLKEFTRVEVDSLTGA